ncbi:MAG: hypothetical protein KC800_03505 [Candidatus Eremiobacteraeota bacterium]|nr:hypothetical protein [Candidatus Eremiobacteraeota bacterium]
MQPQTVNIGGGFSIPFNEPFSFDTALVTDPKTAQLSILGKLSDGTSVELSIDRQTTTFSELQESAAVSSTGLLFVNSIEACGDSSVASATYRFAGSTFHDDFFIQTACFVATAGSGGTRAEPFIVAGGVYEAGFVAQFRGPDTVDVVLSGSDLAYSLKDPVAGVIVDPATGRIEVEATVPAGQRLIVLVSYQDVQTGLSLSSQVEFEVIPASN